MPVYTVNRRRAIILLVLSSILLLTVDLRGNPVIDRMRAAFSTALSPFETAGRVIANPIRNAWHGATDYQALERENEKLRDQLAQQRGNDLAARAAYGDYQELLTLNGLTARYPTVTARVVGGEPGNYEQTVEIDRGGNDGLRVGMAVVNFAGLVGKVTKIYDDRAVVLLLTDSGYTIECKVSGAAAPAAGDTATGDTSTDGTNVDGSPSSGGSTTTEGTAPNGEKLSNIGTTTTVAATTTTGAPASTRGVPSNTGTTSLDPATTTTTTSTSTTTPVTTTPAPQLVTRETGGCTGRGIGKLPAMEYVTENPVFGTIKVGDVITTTGGSNSLAPPDLVIGEVINKVSRASSAGPLIEIKLAADLAHLNFVQILLYVPPNEVPG